MKLIDESGDGSIDRKEWIMYLITPDPDSNLESYDLKLRGLFDKFDEDRNGKIDRTEMSHFLMDYFKEDLYFLDDAEREKLRVVYFAQKARYIVDELVKNKSHKEQDAVPWADFKFVKTKFKREFEEAGGFIEKFVEERRVVRLKQQRLEELKDARDAEARKAEARLKSTHSSPRESARKAAIIQGAEYLGLPETFNSTRNTKAVTEANSKRSSDQLI